MTQDIMPGIDGRNPLGFLAALGVLTAVGGRLFWVPDENRWTPVIERAGDDRPLAQAVVDDLGIAAPVARKRRKKGGGATTKEAGARNIVPYGISLGEPPCDDFGDAREGGVRFATSSIIAASLRGRCAPADVERVVAHACVTVPHKNGGPATTAVRSILAGGQARYLKTLRDIVEAVAPKDIEAAVAGPWHYRKQCPKTSLDPNSDVRNTGLEITTLGAVACVGAERLAIEGLRSLPVAPRGRSVITRGFTSRGDLRWCLWREPLTLATIRAVLGSRGLYSDNVSEWASSLGVTAVFECKRWRVSKNQARLRRTKTIYEEAPAAA